MAAEIDRIDRRILQHLQHDARMSNADLAKAVHVSTATCYRRTQRLFQEGYIHTDTTWRSHLMLVTHKMHR